MKNNNYNVCKIINKQMCCTPLKLAFANKAACAVMKLLSLKYVFFTGQKQEMSLVYCIIPLLNV